MATSHKRLVAGKSELELERPPRMRTKEKRVCGDH